MYEHSDPSGTFAGVERELLAQLFGRVWNAAADMVRQLSSMRLIGEVRDANPARVLEHETPELHNDEVADWLVRQLRGDLERAENHRAAQPPASMPTFGLVTALPEEFVAMKALLTDPRPLWVDGDPAEYVLATVPSTHPSRQHTVVLTLLADTGNDNAAASATNLVRSFGSVSQVVMVGIAAGVPCPDRPREHVRLGDIVVASWGIVDYDHVVDRPEGRTRRHEFPRPSAFLVGRAKRLEADAIEGQRPWEDHLAALVASNAAFARPAADTDVLYAHEDDSVDLMPHPDPAVSGHMAGWPKVHHGLVGSADRSIRNADTREELAREHRLRAIEMEGKGVGDASFTGGRQWFMVRGISDYGDRRHTDLWRYYAAAAAAAYLRALLAACPPVSPHGGGLVV